MKPRSIIHVDMDAFYAAVEVLYNPSLAGLPLIIGALPGQRGVVSTCSYEARKFGVSSAMNIKEAYRRCPHGVYMRPDMDKYAAVSKKIHAIWDDYTDLCEYVSLDEGYLDVTHSAHLFGGAVKVAHAIKARVAEEIGLTCSVGIGYSMMSAKIASEEKKPNGFYQIADANALKELIMGRSVRTIYGIGAQTAEVLSKMNITTVQHILENANKIQEALGASGYDIVRLANGIDIKKVATPPKSKSLGREHTFQKDITDFAHLRNALKLMARRLAFKLGMGGLFAKTVTLKATYGNMTQLTRSKSGEYINNARDIYSRANHLLDKIEKKPIRLIGISLSGITSQPQRQISLFESPQYKRHEDLDKLVLDLQYKHGLDTIATAGELLARKNLKS